MRDAIIRLRESMREAGVTVWVSPCSDAHGSEYIGAADQTVRFLSGFTGDSSTVVVTDTEACLFTDGRYFVQAELELAGSGITLMKMGEPGVPTITDYLRSALTEGGALGFYAPLISARQGSVWQRAAAAKGASLKTDRDLAGEVWEDRPDRSVSPLMVHDLKYAGESAAEKLSRLRAEMKKQGAEVFITGALDETAWITNLRGADIECNPVFLSYLVLTEEDCTLYVQEAALTEEARRHLEKEGITAADYDSFGEALSRIRGKRILLDVTGANYDTFLRLHSSNALVDVLSPAAVLKCVKNDREIRCMKASHLRDGVYVTKYIYYLKRLAREGFPKGYTEVDAARVLDGLRAADPKYVSLSFPTISAYADNAAMCHYMPEEKTAKVLKAKGMYLVDSGAQYLDGTTDVTRTIALGRTTKEERRNYTLTVCGMLSLLYAVFPRGVRGLNLDTFARKALWENGLDFNHGTGHGVGFFNNVHEMPVSVRMRPSADPRQDIAYVPGMVTSDEPGVYIEGRHGIRTENMILCAEHPKFRGFLKFETLTLVPLDPELLDTDYMTDTDLQRYNEYQALVLKKIGPKLTGEERDWLENETRSIARKG